MDGESELRRVYVSSSSSNLGPVTRRSRLEKRRDETRRDRLDLVSSRDFVSRDRLEKKFPSQMRKKGKKLKIWRKFCYKIYFLFTWSRISSRLEIFCLETDRTRPSRVSSRLVTCCLNLVSSRDFRLVTGPTPTPTYNMHGGGGGGEGTAKKDRATMADARSKAGGRKEKRKTKKKRIRTPTDRVFPQRKSIIKKGFFSSK